MRASIIIKLVAAKARDKLPAPRRRGAAVEVGTGPASRVNVICRGRLTLPPRKTASKKSSTHRWSARVTKESNALDLDRSVFTWKDPRRIARSLKHSAEHSRRRKAEPYRSAMSMLTFYINRAGKGLGRDQRRVLERAKDELRHLYGRDEG